MRASQRSAIRSIPEIGASAEHVTCIVILLAGHVCVASIRAQSHGGVQSISDLLSVGFDLRLSGLLVAMLAGIVTLLSSKVQIGVNPDIPIGLSEDGA